MLWAHWRRIIALNRGRFTHETKLQVLREIEMLSEADTRDQAVRAYTSGSAYAEFAENEKGALTKDKLADLTVLSQDIFTAPIPELPKTQSLLTIVGGKIVYEARLLGDRMKAASTP